MSIASEISRLQAAKAAMKTAIEGKGVTVSASATLDDYADYIDDIEQSGGGGIGEFTKYQKYQGTPNSSTNITFTNTLGVVPKLVILTGDPQPEAGDETNYVQSGVFSQTEGCVCMINSAKTAYAVNIGTLSNSVGNIYMNADEVRIMRATSARTFLSTCTYTVELYA